MEAVMLWHFVSKLEPMGDFVVVCLFVFDKQFLLFPSASSSSFPFSFSLSFMQRMCHILSHLRGSHVWGASTKSNGKRRSVMKICGSGRNRNQWPSRYCGGSGAGSDTPSGSQHPAPHAKPWSWTCRGRESASQQLEVRHWSRVETARDQLVRNG